MFESMISYETAVRCRGAFGEMSERFKELVLKTSDSAMSRGFESHSLRHLSNAVDFILLPGSKEKYSKQVHHLEKYSSW